MHLPEHPHALITGGVVRNVAVFASHDPAVIAAVRDAGHHDTAVCCCDQGVQPAPGWTWDGDSFNAPAAK